VNTLTRILVAAAAGLAPAIALPLAAGQVPGATARFAELQNTLRRTHASGDTAAYLETSRTLHGFLNGSALATLQLMSAENLAGKQDDALRSFAQFVAMGQTNDDALRAEKFNALRTTPRFQAIYGDMAANTSIISNTSEVFHLNPSVPIPEDIDFDPAAKRFYNSSVLG
jgi:hypothetical protein